ncbi:DUF6916 family protein [Calidithermus chliarophilus]|uniref:DUF6916 family protein n=1 Tax=Calidithermus chliarophilus TaxID=52023 RepID=UPI0004091711|nr:hypothetical protein [Calidithermus chliarophilus]
MSGPLLTLALFEPLVGSVFSIPFVEGSFELTLIEAQPLPPRVPGARREPFALLFRGPRSPVLPQRIYPLEHPTLGRQEIFVVPIGPDDAGMRYEAVFG